MHAVHRRVKLTYDDFVLFPDDGTRHELIDGEHYVTPSPNIRHQQIYRRTTGGFGRAIELSREANDVLATALLPRLDLPLTRFLRD